MKTLFDYLQIGRFKYVWIVLHEGAVYLDILNRFRSIRKVQWRPSHLEPPISGFEGASPALAVSCHIYYEDFIPDLIQTISRIEIPFDLFITTPSEHIFHQIEDLRDRLPNSKGEGTYRLVPNRGRNFGPLLVEFGAQISQEYDYVLHIHSKRSVHAKSLTGWAHFLLTSLLPNSGAANQVLAHFENNQEIGLIYPPYYEYLGLLHDPWSGNRALGDFWLREHGFVPSAKDFTFPAGGMFWARTSAIQPLLNQGWSYEDFAPEHTPDEITFQTAYVVERLVSVVAEQSGFKSLYCTDKGFTFEDSFRHRRGIFTNFLDRLLVRNVRS